MKLKLVNVLLIIAALVICVFTGFLLGAASASGSSDNNMTLASLRSAIKGNIVDQALHKLERRYYREIDDESRERLMHGAVHGMFNVLREEPFNDNFSAFYDPEIYDELQAQTTGEYAGIGILMGSTDNGMYPQIVTVFPETPALENGLQEDDIITEIDGEETFGMPLDEVAIRLKGEPGTDVSFTVYRSMNDEYIDLTVTRRKVEFKSVNPGELLDGDVGYIRITSFSEDTGYEFRNQMEYLEGLTEGRGLSAVIIDLRNNAGGLVHTAIEVADCFVKDGLLLEVEQRDYPSQMLFADPEVKKYDIPVVIQVNRNTASASEILSGALKDHGIATLVGEKSYGKGVVQEVVGLEFDPDLNREVSAVAITIGEYHTPSMNKIHGVGIEPNVWYDINNQLNDDPVLQRLEDEILGLLDEVQEKRTEMNRVVRTNDLARDRALEIATMLGNGEMVEDIPKLEVETELFEGSRLSSSSAEPEQKTEEEEEETE